MSKLLKSTLYVSAALTVGAGLPAAALAQEAPSSATSVQQIEQVVVTATRRQQRLQDVPISMSVFNQQQLNNQNITDADQLANYTPSLQSDNRFGSSNSTFSIRGFTQEIRTAPSVGVFFADVVAPRSGASGFPAGNGAGPGMLFDLQNVQVLKGPQGTLFGRNTTGGDVLLVPVKPKPTFGGYLEGSYGNYDMKRIQGVINIPVNNKMRLRLGVDHQSRDGYLNNVGVGPRHFGNVDYTAARASFVWDITPNVENYTIVSFTDSDTRGTMPRLYYYNQNMISNYNAALPAYGAAAAAYGASPTPANLAALQGALGALAQLGTFVPEALAAKAQMARTAGDYWAVDNYLQNPRNHTRQWQVINTTTWQASDNLTIKNIASYSQFHQADTSQFFGTNFTTLPVVGVTYLPGQETSAGLPLQTSSGTPSPGKYTAAQWNVTEELQFQGHAYNNKLTWQAGAYMELSNPLETTGYLSSNFADCPQPLSQSNVSQCLNPYLLLNGATIPGRPTVYGGGASLQSGTMKYRDYALYGQATYDLTDKLKFTGGFRYTWDKTIGFSQNINYFFTNPVVVSPTSALGVPVIGLGANTASLSSWQACMVASASLANHCAATVSQNSQAPTWLVELQYSPTDSIMTYAKYSRGYRQGGVVTAAPAGLQTFSPEKVDAYEIGAKTSWAGKVPGVFDFAAFYNDFSNQQLQLGIGPCVADPVCTAYQATHPGLTQQPYYLGGAPTTAIVNAGKSRIWGFEINTSISPMEGLRFDVAYSYLNSLLQRFDTTAAAAVAAADGVGVVPTTAQGEALPQTPENKVTFTAAYTLPISDDYGSVTVSGTYVYQDSYLTTAPITTFTPGGSLYPRVGPMRLLNFNINWTAIFGSQFDGSFFITNALNAQYATWHAGIQSYGFDYASVGMPRMYGFRLRYNFD